jgi:uncharacterized protein YkwD
LTLWRGSEKLHTVLSLRMAGRVELPTAQDDGSGGCRAGRPRATAGTTAASMNTLFAVPMLCPPRCAMRAAAAVLGMLVVGMPALAADVVPADDQVALAHAHVSVSVQGRDDAQPSPYAQRLAALINAYRADRNLPPLELVSELNVLASEHSLQMAVQGQLSHGGFRDRFDRTSARICVENVGVNFPHAEAQLDGWRASPGHHRNLLEPKVGRMGIAKVESFVTFFACG